MVPRVLDHVSLGVSDLERSRGFYARALAPLGLREHGPWRDGARETSFGAPDAYDFAITVEKPVGPGQHVAFAAAERAQVDQFHAAALAAGGRDDGAPGPRPEYSPDYYGAFVLDPDGYRIEAVHHLRPPPPRDGVPEAELRAVEGGLQPATDGWFVLGVREARWRDGTFGAYTRFEGDPRFPSVGVNIGVLAPGQASCMYHGEGEQEDFLVLAGECLLLIEEQERRLKQWDFVHCPPWTRHVLVGAGEGPCTVLALGSRSGAGVIYPASPLALGHAAGVATETDDPALAYEGVPEDTPASVDEGWLPR